MKKFIVCTTINKPTEAIKKFAQLQDWNLIIVGDKKTPHSAYKNYNYFSPSEQEKKYPKLSKLIGWNCIQRRNLGFIEAYLQGADIVATVDDDNIPYKNWGKNVLEPMMVTKYKVKNPVFDPLSVTEHYKLWHRGYPLQLVDERYEFEVEKTLMKRFLVQADLWDGAPDIDAICRFMYPKDVKFKDITPYFSDRPSPFNSQNTFISRKALPHYFLFPHIGRMDDIWASYYLQSKFKECVVYCKPSVIQKRNKHNLIDDMKAEMLGYEKSLAFAQKPSMDLLPKESVLAFKEYARLLA